MSYQDRAAAPQRIEVHQQVVCANFSIDQCMMIYDAINTLMGTSGECAWAAEYALDAMWRGDLTLNENIEYPWFGEASFGGGANAWIELGPYAFDSFEMLLRALSHEGSHNGELDDDLDGYGNYDYATMTGTGAYGVGNRCAGGPPN